MKYLKNTGKTVNEKINKTKDVKREKWVSPKQEYTINLTSRKPLNNLIIIQM